MADTAKKLPDYDEFLPPKGDERIGKIVSQIFAEVVADKDKLGLPDKWRRNYQLFNALHWKNSEGSALPLVVANMIFKHTQQTLNMLTDNNPTFNLSRSGNTDNTEEQQGYDDLQHSAEHWWVETEQQHFYARSVQGGEHHGIAVEKMVFNERANIGKGEAETIVIDPFQFGVYPVTLTDPVLLQKADAILHFYPLSVKEVKRKWGDAAKDVKPESVVLDELGSDRRELASPTTKKQSSMITTISGVLRQLANWITGDNTEEDDRVLVIECWVHDYSGEYTGDIRMVTVCNGGEIVLDDEDNPSINKGLSEEQQKMTYLYDKFPFAATNSVSDIASFWGQSDYQQLDTIIMEVNKCLSQLVLVKDRAARAKIINPKDSGIQNEEFTNAPGILNPSSAQTSQGIRYLEYPQSQADILQIAELFQRLFFLIAGTFDVDQANVSNNRVIAQRAIAQLLENVQTMMRGKIRNYSRLIRERGRMYCSMVQNWYELPREITYTDKTGILTTKQVQGTKMLVPANLTVVSGSTLPNSKMQQREEATKLFQAQAIDRQQLLEDLDYDNRNEVNQRMMQGPLSSLLQKLQEMGCPKDLLQLVTQVANTDPKQFEKGLKEGKIPTFPAILQQYIQRAMQSGPPQEQVPALDQAKIQNEMAEATRRMAEAKKHEAETQLTIEKIATERVKQQVQLAGVTFDEEHLKMERAKLVSEIQRDLKKADEEVEKKVEEKVGEIEDTKSFLTNKPGFNEQGIKSDNETE